MFENATINKIFESYSFNINKILYEDLKEDTPIEKLIKYRLINGLTQREMANKLGIGFSTLCRWEQSNISNLPNKLLI